METTGGSAPDPKKKDRGYIFRHLVYHKGDIPGYIAYILYKYEKIEHIRRFKKDNHREPTPGELLEFRNLSCNSERIEGYRKRGEKQFDDFNQDIYERIGRQIEKQYNDIMDQRIREAVQAALKESKPKTWLMYVHSFFQSVIYTLFLAVFASAVYIAKHNSEEFLELLKRIFT